MNSKEFKQMIKKHQVKQTFCLPYKVPYDNFYLYRVYINTEDPSNMYVCEWKIDYVARDISKVVRSITSEEYKNYLIRYKTLAADYKKDKFKLYNATAYAMKELEACPMYQKKFWQIALDTITFMPNDRRI